MTDLVLAAPASPQSGPSLVVGLTFGNTLATPVEGGATVSVLAVLPLPTLSLLVAYDPRAVKRFVGTTAMQAQHPAQARRAGVESAAGIATQTRPCVSPAWRTGRNTARDTRAAHARAQVNRPHLGTAWAMGTATSSSAASQHQVATPVQSTASLPWQWAGSAATAVCVVGEVAAMLRHAPATPWGVAAGLRLVSLAPHHPATHRTGVQALAVPWEWAHRQRNGFEVRPGVVPPQPPAPVHLLLQCPSRAGDALHALALVFGRYPCAGLLPAAPLYILPARFYMAVHQIDAHLLPSLAPLPIFDVSLSADSGSFGWSFSASAPPDAFDMLAPTGGLPTSIRITLDGLQWVFVVDSLQRTEQFGKRGTRISGRSATALVGNPYSRETARLSTTARNAQQLAAAALDLTGVALDWGIDDWLVPAGAWSHSGTPLAAVQAIAEAVGGYVNSHRSDPTLLVRHPYPTLPGGVPGGPWNWDSVAGADVELAPSAIITSSLDRRDGPDVDGIYVSGTAQGVLAHVKRTGTAGAKLASMISDPLITANIAAQQRGLSVLGAAGAKHLVQISLPVLTGASQPGVLDVGQLVQINEATPWRGRVRSVSVQAAQPKVRQTITLERHLA